MIVAKSLTVAQGDLIIRRVKKLPPEAKPEERKSRLVLAHSETGHHHAIDEDGCVRYSYKDPLVCYLRIDAEHADLVHHRPFDTHETIRLLKGTYEVRRQREWTPEGWRRVED